MVLVSDFVGKHQVAVNDFTLPKLMAYIDRYEQRYLIELFGQDLYDLWVIDPLVAPYDLLTNPFTFQSSCGTIYHSTGVKDMLLGFIYFDYVTDLNVSQSVGGAVLKANENSNKSTGTESLAWQRHIESVTTFKAIQERIKDNLEDYPTFKGVEKMDVIPFF